MRKPAGPRRSGGTESESDDDWERASVHSESAAGGAQSTGSCSDVDLDDWNLVGPSR